MVEHHLFCVNPKGEEPKQQTDQEKNRSFKRNEKQNENLFLTIFNKIYSFIWISHTFGHRKIFDFTFR